jgi:zinc and cadmium transporter
MVEEPHPILMSALAGFAIFFALERLLMKHIHFDTHEHKEHGESLPIMTVIADSSHNLLDGIVIALAYIANPLLGLPTALAIAAHEVPQEISEFAILLDQGWSKTKIILVNLLSASSAFVGMGVAYLALPLIEPILPHLLAGVAGIFIYLSASQIIPEIHHRAGHSQAYRIIGCFLAGILLIGIITTSLH